MAEDAKYFDKKGLELYSHKNYTEAIENFERAINQDPLYVDSWVHKGNAQRSLKDFNASLQSYSSALELDRNNTAALQGMVAIYTTLKDNAKASSAASKLTEISPKNKAYWLKEGNLLQTQGLYNESIFRYDSALNLNATYKDALYAESISFMALSNNARAMDLLDRLLEIDPSYKQAYNVKGLVLEADKRYAQALEAYDMALKIDPQWKPASANKNQVLLLMGKLNESVRGSVTI